MSIPVYYTPGAEERPKIIDSNGNEFYLPQTFNIRSEPISRKSQVLDIAFAHGAKDVADGKLGTRTIEISGKIWAETDGEFLSAWDQLAAQILKENIILQDKGRQINCSKIIQVDYSLPSQSNYNYGEFILYFLCLDPFWYAIAAKTKVFTITGSPTVIGFELQGNVDVFPLITVAHGASNADFTIKNTSDGNRSLRVQDSGAAGGTTEIIDCAAGTVTRGGANKIDKMTGLFLRLLGGRANSIEYTGANCTLSFFYKEAWL